MKKSCAIGCAALLILAAALVGWAMMKGPGWWAQGKSLVAKAMAEEMRVKAMEGAWVPPSPKPDAAWAPATVGDWTLQKTEQVSGWPELNITRAGQRMVYGRGAATIEIGVVAANDLEKEVLVTRLINAVKESPVSHKAVGSGRVTLSTHSGNVTTTRGNRTHVKAGDAQTRVWWLKDWLFFFRSEDVDPDIVEEYLRAISAPALTEEGKPEGQ